MKAETHIWEKISLLKIILQLITVIFLFGTHSVTAQTKKSESEKLKNEYHTGAYRNLFLEAGYGQTEIDKKVEKAYLDLFEGPNRIYFEVGDSMAYVSDIKNHDARTEGLSYGMMIAVQFNKKEVFDRIWRWSKKYLQHQEGPRKGYFAWSIDPKTLKKNSEGSASDGELYYITSLLFASNRWGNNTGIDYCLLYTSDAADEEDSVDLGGRRIIKKKKEK